MGIKLDTIPLAGLSWFLLTAVPVSSAPYVQGWPTEVGTVRYSSPAVADIDGDGKREVAVATWDDLLYLLSYDGKTLDGFPVNTWDTPGNGEESSPILADLDGNGELDVLFLTNEGKLIALTFSGKTLSGWPIELEGIPNRATPVVQNLTDYPGLEVIAAVENDTGVVVYVFHGDGTAVAGWPIRLKGMRSPYLAVGDFDGDNSAEITVVTGRKVYAFHYNGSPVDGWPVEIDTNTVAAPVIADIEGNGNESVIFGTADGYVYAMDGKGRDQAGWPVKLCNNPVTTAPALGDVNGDGRVEIVFVSGEAHITSSVVWVMDARGRIIKGFPATIQEPVAASPIAADVDGNGYADIIVATCAGTIQAINGYGEIVQGFPINVTSGKITATPTATDIDGDGTLDVVIATDDGSVETINIGSPYNAETCPWPTLGGDHWRSGKYHPRKNNTLNFEVRAKSDYILVTWEKAPSPERSGWRVLRAVGEGGLPAVYSKILETDQELSGIYSYEDRDIESDEIYYYLIEEILTDGGVIKYGPGIIRAPRTKASILPETKILNAYPNPFSGAIKIPFRIGQDAGDTRYTIKVYDLSGKAIRTLASDYAVPGEYEVSWDSEDEGGNPVGDGVYVVRLSTEDKRIVFSKSIILSRNE
jgi:hypothetical protein